MVTSVSDENLDAPGEDDMKTARELHTESHDPAVPEAYAAFMRTGWGDRDLDLPRQPVADRAAERRAKLASMFPGERAGAALRDVQGPGQRHRLQVPLRHRPHLLLAATRPATQCW